LDYFTKWSSLRVKVAVGDPLQAVLSPRQCTHDLGALVQDLVEERDRASIRSDPRPFVVYGHSRAARQEQTCSTTLSGSTTRGAGIRRSDR